VSQRYGFLIRGFYSSWCLLWAWYQFQNNGKEVIISVSEVEQGTAPSLPAVGERNESEGWLRSRAVQTPHPLAVPRASPGRQWPEVLIAGWSFDSPRERRWGSPPRAWCWVPIPEGPRHSRHCLTPWLAAGRRSPWAEPPSRRDSGDRGASAEQPGRTAESDCVPGSVGARGEGAQPAGSPALPKHEIALQWESKSNRDSARLRNRLWVNRITILPSSRGWTWLFGASAGQTPRPEIAGGAPELWLAGSTLGFPERREGAEQGASLQSGWRDVPMLIPRLALAFQGLFLRKSCLSLEVGMSRGRASLAITSDLNRWLSKPTRFVVF